MRSFNVEALREEFPIVQRLVYFNTGTAGVCPLSVAEKLWEGLRAFETEGEAGWGAAVERMEAGRQRLAAFLGAEPNEIAFTRNATDGVNLIVEGLVWNDGDEVLLSEEEHPAMLYPWTYLAQRRGVILKRFGVGWTPGETVANVAEALTPKTRVVATSHVSSVTGKRVPVAEIVRLCRERDIRTLVDGAQAVGQFRMNLRALGVDYYTGNLHKWLHGPKGTGFLYVAAGRLNEVMPKFVGAGSGYLRDGEVFAPVGSARRFEYGTRDFARYGALVPLLDWFESVGFESIWGWMQALTAHLRAGLAALPHVVLHTPEPWEDSSALTTFSISGASASFVYETLWTNGQIRLRTVAEHDGNRVSTALFNTRAEVDRLIASLETFSAR